MKTLTILTLMLSGCFMPPPTLREVTTICNSVGELQYNEGKDKMSLTLTCHYGDE